MQIQISWLLQKPTDLDLHYLQMQGISGFSRTRVKIAHLYSLILVFAVLHKKYYNSFQANTLSVQTYSCWRREMAVVERLKHSKTTHVQWDIRNFNDCFREVAVVGRWLWVGCSSLSDGWILIEFLWWLKHFFQPKSTLQPLYNMVCYMVLDRTRFKNGSQKCIDYIEKWP